MTTREAIERRIEDYRQRVTTLEKEIARDKERALLELQGKYDSSIATNLAGQANRTTIDITKKQMLEEYISDLEILLVATE